MNQDLVQQCKGCVKAGAVICKVFKDPTFQHRDGRQCYGRDTDPEWEDKVNELVKEYGGKNNKTL